MGEGRGHASRARSMAEALRHKHRIVIYTSHDAFSFLSDSYQDDPQVEIREIPGLVMHYSDGKLDLTQTIVHGCKLRWNLGRIATDLREDFERDQPDIVVTDFEPVLPCAARRFRVPVMSLDHQHFLLAYDLSRLPLRLRKYAWLMRIVVKTFGLRQKKTVVSAFYFPPLRPAYRNAVQVGPLLRPLVRATPATDGEHILCYFRRHTPDRVIDMLSEVDHPIRIYGLGERESQSNLTFCKIDEEQFVRDLASAKAVIAAAGNQLSGETLYFGKPFLALPERAHHEQCINAFFVKDLGGGDWRFIEELTAADITRFLSDLEAYRENLRHSPHEFDGTADAAREIEAFLDLMRR